MLMMVAGFACLYVLGCTGTWNKAILSEIGAYDQLNPIM